MRRLRIALLSLILLIQTLLLTPIGLVAYFLWYPFDRKWVFGKYYSKLWAYPLVWFNPGWSIEIEGAESIEEGKSYVIIANHNTFFDIPATHFLKLNFRWVSKREVLIIPPFGWVLFVQRSITIKRGNTMSAKAMFTKGKRLLDEGISVAIFPEGTRSTTGKLGRFKSGAFMLAKHADVDILPVVIYNSRESIYGTGGRVKFKVKVLKPISMAGRDINEMTKEYNDIYREQLNESGE